MMLGLPYYVGCLSAPYHECRPHVGWFRFVYACQLISDTGYLAGIAITAISGALVGLLSYLADDGMLRTLTFWNMGSLAAADYPRVGLLLLCCLPIWWRLPRLAPALNALLLGESEARHLGVEVERVKRELVLLTALGVGACVAAC